MYVDIVSFSVTYWFIKLKKLPLINLFSFSFSFFFNTFTKLQHCSFKRTNCRLLVLYFSIVFVTFLQCMSQIMMFVLHNWSQQLFSSGRGRGRVRQEEEQHQRQRESVNCRGNWQAWIIWARRKKGKKSRKKEVRQGGNALLLDEMRRGFSFSPQQ